ncbi:TetR/AcrR family transcriptional regulator [Oceanicella sp. SM1341]|uniref:TetR/AcrR family transcriptional regulator n=1 Tax=Oceanicella sp. SM1341 TaxID=1548889 RepID=UPI000E55596D|nr:TetR/AcrR family transcriptional regulator [Oceanicella sp. SM1341]
MQAENDSAADPRREAILAAAAELFFSHGFAATSIDAIIERSGGSKRTIYALFGSKQGLCEALIRENSERIFGSERLDDPTLSLEESLLRFARELLRLFLRPDTAGMYRLVVAEALRVPALAESYMRIGPGRARAWLAGRLERARDELGEIDATRAANQFLGLVRSDVYYETVLGLRDPLSEAEVDTMAADAVRVFLHGVRRG